MAILLRVELTAYPLNATPPTGVERLRQGGPGLHANDALARLQVRSVVEQEAGEADRAGQGGNHAPPAGLAPVLVVEVGAAADVDGSISSAVRSTPTRAGTEFTRIPYQPPDRSRIVIHPPQLLQRLVSGLGYQPRYRNASISERWISPHYTYPQPLRQVPE